MFFHPFKYFAFFSNYIFISGAVGGGGRVCGLPEGWLPCRAQGRGPCLCTSESTPRTVLPAARRIRSGDTGGSDFNNTIYLPSTPEMLSLDVKLLMRDPVLFRSSCDVVGTSLSSCEAVASIPLALCGSWRRGRLSRMPSGVECHVPCPHPRFKAWMPVRLDRHCLPRTRIWGGRVSHLK